jgi:hypothetical protein
MNRTALFPILAAACLVLPSCDGLFGSDGSHAAPSAVKSRALGWEIAHAESNGGLASVWGTGPADVWATGGTADRGLILHFDGGKWQESPTHAKSFLWWVYGTRGDDVYAVGEKGTILHFDGQNWRPRTAPTTKTLYGLWAKQADDVWLVGGDPWGKPGDAVVLRGNAKIGFHDTKVPASLLPEAIFKIYGTPAGHVVAVGTGGAVLRFDGKVWSRDTVPTQSNLISLWGGGGERLFAVGGQGAGEMLRYDGAAWAPVAGVQPGLELYGVFTSPGQSLFAVGAGPRIVEVGTNGDVHESDMPDVGSLMVLHSVWGDGQGATYAVGGTLYGLAPQMTGVILALK